MASIYPLMGVGLLLYKMVRPKNILIFTVVLLYGCAAPKVVSYHNESIDFSEFETFNIVTEIDVVAKNTEEKDKIEEEILREMEARGYRFSQSAEMNVQYRIILEAKTDVQTNTRTYPYYGRRYRYSQTEVSRYSQGILLVEIMNGTTNRLMWSSSLDLSFNRNSRGKKDIGGLIEMVFTKFPIGKE